MKSSIQYKQNLQKFAMLGSIPVFTLLIFLSLFLSPVWISQNHLSQTVHFHKLQANVKIQTNLQNLSILPRIIFLKYSHPQIFAQKEVQIYPLRQPDETNPQNHKSATQQDAGEFSEEPFAVYFLDQEKNSIFLPVFLAPYANKTITAQLRFFVTDHFTPVLCAPCTSDQTIQSELVVHTDPHYKNHQTFPEHTFQQTGENTWKIHHLSSEKVSFHWTYHQTLPDFYFCG